MFLKDCIKNNLPTLLMHSNSIMTSTTTNNEINSEYEGIIL